MLYHILCMEVQRYPTVNMDWSTLFMCVIVTALSEELSPVVYLIHCILAHSISMYRMCTCAWAWFLGN